MAYADQEMSTNRIVALVAVALIHIAIGYVLVTGLAFEAVSKVVDRVTTVDIEEPPPPEPEDEPPPPEPQPQPETAPPPPVAPPPPMNISPAPPQIRTQPTIPPPAPPALRIPPAAPVGPPPPPPAPPPPPPPPPPPAVPPTQAQPRNAAEWITTSDYRPSWVSRDYAGTVSVSLNVGTNGRVSSCSVTGGSAPQDLKDASCRLIERRARFRPATRNGEEVAGNYSTAIRWQLPD